MASPLLPPRLSAAPAVTALTRIRNTPCHYGHYCPSLISEFCLPGGGPATSKSPQPVGWASPVPHLEYQHAPLALLARLRARSDHLSWQIQVLRPKVIIGRRGVIDGTLEIEAGHDPRRGEVKFQAQGSRSFLIMGIPSHLGHAIAAEPVIQSLVTW